MPKRPDYLFFSDIRQFCHDIVGATSDLSFEEFEKNYVLTTAVCKWLENIGEAANQLSKESKSRYKEIPWRQMIGMRNILVHVYHDYDLQLVFNVCKNEIPNLLQQIENL